MSARAVRDDGAPLYPMGALPADARAALAEAEAMSRLNKADAISGANGVAMPWWSALTRPVEQVLTRSLTTSLLARALFRRLTGATVDELGKLAHKKPRGMLPVYDGDPPKAYPIRAPLLFQRDRLHHALVDRALRLQSRERAAALHPRRIVQEISKRAALMTHRSVHRALAGETAGATIPGCPWCREDSSR